MAKLTGAAAASRRPARRLREILVSTLPIVQREFTTLLRTRKAFWTIVLTVAAAGLIPLTQWPEEGTPMPYLSAMLAYNHFNQVISIASMLLILSVSAGSITSERENGTYESLHNTLIHPTGIVLGKLFSCVAFFVLLLLLTFPIICILYLLGGFEAWDFIQHALWQIASIAFYALIGLWCSMRSERTTRSVIAAFLLFFAYVILTTIVINFFFFFVIGRFTAGASASWIAYIYPGSMILAGLALLFSLLRMAPWPFPAGSRRKEAAAVRSHSSRERHPRPASKTWFTRFLLSDAEAGIPDHWNPMLVATIRSDILSSGRSRRMLFWGFAAVWMLVNLGGCAMAGYLVFLFAPLNTILFLVLFALILPGAAATLITSERELGNFDFLRSSLLTPHRVLLGKMLGFLLSLAGLLGPSLVIGGILAPLVAMGHGDSFLRLATHYLITLAGVVAVSTGCGLLASCILRRTVPALILAYGLAACFFLFLPSLAAVVYDLLITEPGVDSLDFTYISPLMGMKNAFDRGQEMHLEPLIISSCTAAAEFLGLYFLAGAILRRRWVRDGA